MPAAGATAARSGRRACARRDGRVQRGRHDDLDPLAGYLDDHAFPGGGLVGGIGVLRHQLRREIGLDPPGVDAHGLGGESGIADDGAVEGQHGRHPLNLELGQGPPGPLQGLLAGGAGDDQFGDERVKGLRHGHARLIAGVDPDPGTGRELPGPDRSRRGHEVPRRILSVDPELDRVAAGGRVVVAKGMALRDAEHLPDQVQSGDLLADRVLNLKPGVYLQEADRPVLADEELTRARALVPGPAQDRLGRRVQQPDLLAGQERGRGFLHELLVAPLEGTVPGGDDHHVAVRVSQALRLDVPRPVQVALHEALTAPEGGHGLADRGLVLITDLVDRPGHLQATPAAAERGLDGDGQPVLFREGDDLFGTGHRVGRARRERGLDLAGDVPGAHLVAQGLDGRGWRPDPGQSRRDHRPGEVGVLGQEAVAGVDRVGAGLSRDLDDLLDAEIRLRRGGPVQRVRLVGQPGVQPVEVLFGVDRHAGQPGVPAGPDDAYRDLAAVRDEDLPHGDLSSATLFPGWFAAGLRWKPFPRNERILAVTVGQGSTPAGPGDVSANRVITLCFAPVTSRTI